MPGDWATSVRFHLAFKAYDAHELACHFVARHAGLYEQHGLAPVLADSTFISADELPNDQVSVACGAAAADFLHGNDVRVVFVAARRPMFWLYVVPEVHELKELSRQTIAGYPADAPPAAFLRGVWARRGQAPDELKVAPARDDIARLGMLADGSARAALLSSAIPRDVMAKLGFEPLLFFGDEIELATTGLAAPGKLCEENQGLIRALCACYRDAIALIHGEADVLQKALASAPIPMWREAPALVRALRRCYSANGTCPIEELEIGLESMAVALNVQPRPAGDLYDFAFLPD
jgi:hypothetical protein